MKISFFLFLCSIFFLDAQIEFGGKLGYHLSQHYGVKDEKDDYSVKSSFRHGFTGGFFVYLPITEKFGMQYEANYAQKGSSEIITVAIFDEKIPLNVQYETDYLEFPIIFSYLFPISQHVKYRASSGSSMSFLVSNSYRLDGVWQDEDGEVLMEANESNFAMEQFDFSFLYGGEILYQWRETSFVFGYRFTIGWNALKMPTYAYMPVSGEEELILIDNPPVELKNQAYAFTIGVIF